MQKIVGDYNTLVMLEGDEAINICKLGQGEACCAFLASGSGGFQCIRMDYPLNMMIHSKLEKGLSNAKGVGGWKSCLWEEK